jgi:PAS domain S-box-containing protein
MAKARVMIVEDEAIVASMIAGALKKFGYELIESAASGETAVAAALQKKPDLILMDIHLHGEMDGIAAAEAIRKQADIPVIYLTALTDEATLERAKKTLPYGYIPKPLQEIKLKTTIEMALYKHHFELRLKMSEAKFRSLFENSRETIYIADADHRLLEINPAGLKLFGYAQEEMMNSKIEKLYFNPAGYRTVLAALNESHDTSEFEVELKKKDGSPMTCLQTMQVLMDEKGAISGFQGSILDISERKQIESQRQAALETLRKSEENFRLSLDESPLGVRISTAAGETLYANRVLLGFYGFTSIEEFNRTPLRERYTPKSYGEFKKRSKTRKKDGNGPNEYEVCIVGKNGEIRSLQVFRKAILWNGENQIQALYRDISESKHWLETFKKFEKTIRGQKMILDQQSSSVEELIKRLTRSREELGASYRELKTKKDDLVRSEKLAFTGRMAAGIAHEIRNPLTNVILSLRQLKKSEKIKPEVLKYAEIMERNTNRIEYLISELLNCARPVKLSIQPCDIHLLIRDILNVHKVRLKTQKITVVQNLAAHPAILAFDKEQLGRVFLNLIANAIEAMDSGGKLTIATKNEKKKFVCRIQDNGRGIPKKNLMNVFDPFFSTKKGGTGLGLSTCQNIVTSHGGLIEVESAWKKGSVFSVSLPLEAKPSERKEKKKSRS